MFVPSNKTPKKKDGGHDDSGYDGLVSARKEDDVLEDFNAWLVKKLFDRLYTSRQDKLWITVASHSLVLVMLASLCYLCGMGETIDIDQLGGKRAAMKHYYDRAYGSHNGATIL